MAPAGRGVDPRPDWHDAAVTLIAVPNVSEGRDEQALDAIADAFGPGLLHRSSDPDHHRSVFTLAGEPGALHTAVLNGARAVLARIDLTHHEGVHPRVGALDVAPIVYLRDEDRGAATAEALVLADELGELGIPVFLYGDLGGGRTRAELRRGGPPELQRRMAAGELTPDFGPRRGHPTAGGPPMAARPPPPGARPRPRAGAPPPPRPPPAARRVQPLARPRRDARGGPRRGRQRSRP